MNIKNLWSEEDISFLVDNYKNLSQKQLLKHFDGKYTRDSINRIAKKYQLATSHRERVAGLYKISSDKTLRVLDDLSTQNFTSLSELLEKHSLSDHTFVKHIRENPAYKRIYDDITWGGLLNSCCVKCGVKLSEFNYSKYGRNLSSIKCIRGVCNKRSRMCDLCFGENRKNSYRGTLQFKLDSLWRSAKSRAGRLNWDFDISKNDLTKLWDLQNGQCAYSGRPLSFCSNSENMVSLDRIENSRGYVVDNIQLITWEINNCKGGLSNSSFISICSEITHHTKRSQIS